MLQRIFLWIQRYERHLSAFSMVAGFTADTLLFGRIDLWQTHLVFISYAVICFITIPLLHFLETTRPAGSAGRVRLLLPLAIQFALGGFWSGFVIFYGRSADIGASWPFLIFLGLVLLGSEYFNEYHDRLVFTSVLFFFALYSYAIFAVPIYTLTIGTPTFLLSGAIAIGVFSLFTMLLRVLARKRFLVAVWRIRVGALMVLALMNIFYFTNLLPPLPLSAEEAGVYHSVVRAPSAYLATTEAESWQVRFLGLTPTLHVALGESLSAYTSLFAPTTLTVTVQHLWEWYDPVKKEWAVKAAIVYPIVGGRDGGYRGYSTVFISESGEWRVSIETADGRRITRLPFIVERVALPPSVETITLK